MEKVFIFIFFCLNLFIFSNFFECGFAKYLFYSVRQIEFTVPLVAIVDENF